GWLSSLAWMRSILRPSGTVSMSRSICSLSTGRRVPFSLRMRASSAARPPSLGLFSVGIVLFLEQVDDLVGTGQHGACLAGRKPFPFGPRVVFQGPAAVPDAESEGVPAAQGPAVFRAHPAPYPVGAVVDQRVHQAGVPDRARLR